MSLEVIAFDLGGVLVDVDLSRAWRRLGRPHGAAFFEGHHHRAVSTGSLDGAAFLERAGARAGKTLHEVRGAWRAVVRPFPGARTLVDAVGPRVVAWSNTDPEHVDALHGLPSALFSEASGLSYQLRAMKPADDFFRAALERLGVDAERVAFLDDRAENVAAARALGVRARRVRGVDEATHALRALGALD